jgi:hypothetical protein
MAGYPHDPGLRARIQAFSPDEPGAVFPFGARLARQNGWTRPFAGRVMEEYRRFVYLAMTAGHPVTPSVQVDQAWHLHLTFTRSYWEEMCGRVLGRPLHHEPTRGGRAEGAKFVDWYARTLDSYQRAFGHAPPADVWPSPAERFAPAGRIRPVSDATHWIIRKPRPRRATVTAVVAMGALLAVAACAGDGGAAGGLALLGAGLVVFAFLASTRGALAEKRRRRMRRRSAASGASAGYLFGGSPDRHRAGDDRYGDGDGDGGDGGGDGGDGGGGCGGGCSG